jgi:hypothetical protein
VVSDEYSTEIDRIDFSRFRSKYILLVLFIVVFV